MIALYICFMQCIVAPRVGAWIETGQRDKSKGNMERSHPVWVRGLKPSYITTIQKGKTVAPRVGAWIETRTKPYIRAQYTVAPRVGAWIETLNR